MPGTPATVTPQADGGTLVRLHTPQRAITPGQAGVLDALIVHGSNKAAAIALEKLEGDKAKTMAEFNASLKAQRDRKSVV